MGAQRGQLGSWLQALWLYRHTTLNPLKDIAACPGRCECCNGARHGTLAPANRRAAGACPAAIFVCLQLSPPPNIGAEEKKTMRYRAYKGFRFKFEIMLSIGQHSFSSYHVLFKKSSRAMNGEETSGQAPGPQYKAFAWAPQILT